MNQRKFKSIKLKKNSFLQQKITDFSPTFTSEGKPKNSSLTFYLHYRYYNPHYTLPFWKSIYLPLIILSKYNRTLRQFLFLFDCFALIFIFDETSITIQTKKSNSENLV